jgi:BirA family biotin operon repressor/biotin-[acetyl-CoA-carboxylase] ligase
LRNFVLSTGTKVQLFRFGVVFRSVERCFMIELPIGHHVIDLPEVDSTNSYMAKMLQATSLSDGTAIMAQFQSAGRGQRSSFWESERDSNLLVSYVLYPSSLKADENFIFNQAMCLGIRDFIARHTSEPVMIKWPNDIMVGNGKIAGLLIENSIRGSVVHQSIVGIGININQRRFGNYAPQPASLALLNDKVYQLRECFNELSESLGKWYTIFTIGNKRMIKESYSVSLFRKGASAMYETGGRRFKGTIQGTMPQGELVIVQEDGFEYIFKNKEVKFIF